MGMPWLASRSFGHGVHPPEHKEETRDLPIRSFPFASELVVPLLQHLGAPAIPEVREGQRVARGEILARPDGFMSVAVHAPVSGTVRSIRPAPSITGRMLPAIYLETRPGDTQEVIPGVACSLESATPEDVRNAIQAAGIVGLGGAAFPTHAKLRIPEGTKVDTLILNGAECEPYLTTDHRVMLEQAPDLFLGIRYLLRAIEASRAILAVEKNKADASQHLRRHKPDDLALELVELEVKYPQGAEKLLIRSLLGREVPSGGLPSAVGALVVNVATAAEIGRLLPHGRGIIERVVTLGGPGVERKGNYRIPIGTPLRFLLEQVGVSGDVDEVFLGGPMMGVAASSLEIPLTKGISGVIVYAREQGDSEESRVYPCIRCGQCLAACPMYLDPATLMRLSRHGDYSTMVDRYHLMDCFECGCCAYVCPSHIPLVQHFRIAKAGIRRGLSA